MFGTAGSPEGLDLIRTAGVTEAFNHREEGYHAKMKGASGGFDVILENLSNVNLGHDLEMIKKGESEIQWKCQRRSKRPFSQSQVRA